MESNFIEFGELELYIEKSFDCNTMRLWLISRNPRGREFYQYNGGDRLIEGTTIEGCARPDTVKPFIELPMEFAKPFLKLMAKALSEEGIKTVDENLLQGKMDAMTDHMADMRNVSNKLLEILLK
jgi:hypothetical protein